MKKKTKNDNIVEKVEVITDNQKNEKENTQNSLIYPIVMATIALILIFLSEETNKIISFVIGGFTLLLAIISIAKYFIGHHLDNYTLIRGIIYLLIAILILFHPLLIMKFMTLIIGFYLVVKGCLKIHSAYLSKNILVDGWKIKLISGIIISIMGIALIINPYSGLAVTKIAGVLLLIVSIFEIIDIIKTKQKNK